MTCRELELIENVVKRYLESGDFNGYRVTPDLDAELIRSLIADGKLELHCEDRHPNPSIRAFPAEEIREQIGKIHHVDGCLYPTPEYLKEHVPTDPERPFTTMLARGAAQLEFRAFDLSVLEFYRNDPRYYYNTDDINGTISVRDEHSELRESDKVFLQTFGYCYDEDTNRAVAVFLKYLHGLTPEHQRIWQAKLIDRKHRLHPDYRRVISGEFRERLSIYDALLSEQQQINLMAEKLDKPPLFRTTYEASCRPKGFGILIRPTQKAYEDFVHMLDKLMSDNLNRDFFKGDLEVSETATKQSGETLTIPIPTIRLLEQRFEGATSSNKAMMLGTFRKIRRLRMQPAHVLLDDDQFDQKFLKDQLALIQDAYFAVRTIRSLFETHLGIEHEVPEWLTDGGHWVG